MGDDLKQDISVDGMSALGRELAAKPAGLEASAGILLAKRFLKVRDREGLVRPLEANKAQTEFERARGQHNIILKARQMGMTTWVSGRFFLKTITTPGALTVQVAHTREAAESIFRIVQRFWDEMPEAYRTGPLKRSRANVRQMIFPALDSEFRVVSAADGNAGRGLTIQNLHCSEVSRWKGDAKETLAGLRAALAPSGELVLESTPNGAYGCFYDEWQGAKESGLAHHFLPWWLEAAYVANPVTDLSDEEIEARDRYGLSPEQMGFRRTLERSYRGLRSQEFAEDPERCFRASGDCCFEIEVIEKRLLELGDAAVKRRHGALLVWLSVRPDKEYLVAVDPAGGGSDGDYSAIQVIELAGGLQCAELREKVRPSELSRIAAELAREYNDAMIVVERNNHGIGVHTILSLTEHYGNIYESDGLEGFLTTATSKPRIISRFGALLFEQPGLFHSRRLLGECRTFVTQANGSTGAITGAHDDCLMAMAIAQEVRAERMVKGRR
ncbi:phage terminase large subunit family protein [Granulicella arctica]|uniref:phage terminase large subunit family protein n=1 Tax=Granulicella arctica TaxID=940613 RepID=UPI0021DF8902|nr:terminase [Granulicella arctica]